MITLNIFRLGWNAQGQGDRFALDPTQNQRCLQATTILYYSFFLPGVILNQFIYWFAAGVLNIRAARKIAWPKAQDIGELKLDFVDIGKVTPLQQAIVSTAPFVVGLGFIWLVANNVLDVNGFLSILRGETQGDLWMAINRLTSTPDFWLWVYLLFAVSNTMMPNYKNLKGWRTILIIIAAVTVGLFLLTNGSQAVFQILTGPVAEGLSVVAGTFAVIIAVDVLAVAVLGAVESIIERITGDSATFKNGKMITMRREELLKQREQERQREQQARQQAQKQRALAPAGPPSIYKLPLPIPGGPGREAIQSDAITISKEEAPALTAGTPPQVKPGAPALPGAAPASSAPPPPLSAPKSPVVTPPSADVPKPTDSPFASVPKPSVTPPSTDAPKRADSPFTPMPKPASPPLPTMAASPFARPAPPSKPDEPDDEEAEEDEESGSDESDTPDELPDDKMLMGEAVSPSEKTRTSEQPVLTTGTFQRAHVVADDQPDDDEDEPKD